VTVFVAQPTGMDGDRLPRCHLSMLIARPRLIGNPPAGVGALERIENLLHIAAFVLAEEFDFARAARRLQLSVPELTERIAELESKLSLILFEQDSNHVALTAEGLVYIEQLRKSRFLRTC
jgi:hypothetical protein